MYKARSLLFEGMRSAIDNERGHSVVTDLTENDAGRNSGASALELTLMSLAGCVTTIYSDIAHNKRLPIKKLLCNVTAEKSNERGLDNVIIHLKVVTDGPQDRAERIFKNTMDICPVGKIFKAAGASLTETMEIVDDF